MELDISPEMEKAVVFADGNLVKRALRNLIGNSVRHNPQGCQIRIRLYEKDGMACFCITDSGTGIPQVVVENMDTQTEKIHIMGLRLARQIARAHGGNMMWGYVFRRNREKKRSYSIVFGKNRVYNSRGILRKDEKE